MKYEPHRCHHCGKGTMRFRRMISNRDAGAFVCERCHHKYLVPNLERNHQDDTTKKPAR